MGNSAKIRHRRRRRADLRRARSELVAERLAEMVLKPLRERRRLPLGVVEVSPGELRVGATPAESPADALARELAASFDPQPSR